jgi:DNA-binding FrmR family transcriptional regulator
MSNYRDTCDDLVAQLEAITEQLSDVSQALLFDAIDGKTEAISIEKRIQKARGHLAKTIRLLQEETMG